MIELAKEVEAALGDGAPVVALESTIIAHGLPYPDNLELALELEEAVRSTANAIPATIGIVDGRPRVGLTQAEIEALARPGASVGKANAADIAAFIASKRTAATTVSATAALAIRTGIPLIATGGIGGVHRGDSADVSCDLITLGREPVAVVAAGAKSILDLPRTLEALETQGVLVIGHETDELPAFYCRTSGLRLEHRMDEPTQIAAALSLRFNELHQGGVLIANPPPVDAALQEEVVEEAIHRALVQAEAALVTGKSLTPFLLRNLAKALGRPAIAANRALAVANATLAARVAAACVKIEFGGLRSWVPGRKTTRRGHDRS